MEQGIVFDDYPLLQFRVFYEVDMKTYRLYQIAMLIWNHPLGLLWLIVFILFVLFVIKVSYDVVVTGKIQFWKNDKD